MSQFPNIEKACLAVALDNGGINRFRSVDKQRREYAKWLAQQDYPNLAEIDQWLGTLSKDDLETVCVGGQDEPGTIAIRASAPAFLDDLLNSYFDEVC